MNLQEEIEQLLYDDISVIDSDPELTAEIILNKILDAAVDALVNSDDQFEYDEGIQIVIDIDDAIEAINKMRGD